MYCALCFIFVFIIPITRCTNNNDNDFKSVPTTVKTHVNDTVLLPCYLDSTGSEETGGIPESIKWYKDTILIADSSNVSISVSINERIHLWINGSLEVRNIKHQDTGEYMCEIVRKSPWSSIRQMHAIEVLYPPSMETIPESGYLQVKLGDEVRISCISSGVPQPLITWKHKGVEMQLLDNRETLNFIATDQYLSGIYECIASNGVGNPALNQIELNIIYPPEVSCEKSWLHTSPDLRVTLECIVSADPPADIKWFKSNMLVTLDSRVVSFTDDNKNKLLIRTVRISDFGIYTCRASNDLGTAECDTQLSGVANPGVFKEIEQKVGTKSKHSFTLVWEVDSYTKIIEYNLWFRPFQTYNIIKKKDWKKITVPAEPSSGPLHSKAYSIDGLKENTVYEAMLFSRNRYGWSRPSKIWRFSIDGTELKEEVVTQLQIQENIVPVDLVPVPVVSSVTRNCSSIIIIIFLYLIVRI